MEPYTAAIDDGRPESSAKGSSPSLVQHDPAVEIEPGGEASEMWSGLEESISSLEDSFFISRLDPDDWCVSQLEESAEGDQCSLLLSGRVDEEGWADGGASLERWERSAFETALGEQAGQTKQGGEAQDAVTRKVPGPEREGDRFAARRIVSRCLENFVDFETSSKIQGFEKSARTVS